MLGRFGQQRVAIVGSEALIVEAVPALMQRRQHRRRQIGLVDADGEAHVVGAGKKRERMRRAVEPAALEVETHGGQQLPAQVPLAGLREFMCAAQSVGARIGRPHQGHESIAHLVQHGIETRALMPGSCSSSRAS